MTAADFAVWPFFFGWIAGLLAIARLAVMLGRRWRSTAWWFLALYAGVMVPLSAFVLVAGVPEFVR